MKKYILSFIVVLITACQSFSQKSTISGTVKDSATGETLIGANVVIEELSLSALTNAYGFFSLTAPQGNYTMKVGFIGYTTQSISVSLNKNIKLNIEVAPQSFMLKAVEISGEKKDQNITSTQMSTVKMDVQQIKTLPVLFGEVDILKSITLLPGIQSIGEGNGGIFVRGGGADQNLMLLDEANVYNASHLLGFFSVFNSDAIKDIIIYKGGIPAEYGGRLSSVIDIHTNDGNNKKFTVKGGIGMISSRLTVEAPIKKDRGSFILCGRRTYADLFIRAFGPSEVRNSSLYFYDFNVKANYQLTDKDRVYLSGYFGRDVLSLKRGNGGGLGTNWGNATGTLRWNHIFNHKLFLNTSLITSNYNYLISINSGSNSFGITSSIRDYNLKTGFEYFLNEKNKLKFGTSSIYHVFSPGDVSTNGKSILNDLSIEKKYAAENAVYISNEQTLTKKISMVYGLRYSAFGLLGPGKFFKYDSTGAISDSTIYTSNKLVKQYSGLEPRISARYQLDSLSSFKISYMRTSQYIQLLSNTTASSPFDLWVPSSNNILPQIGDQYALGYFRNFLNNTFESSVEVYYRTMFNQVDYKPGADLVLNPLVESQLYFGKGRAYGAEFFLKKNSGKFTGWISYTLSRTERQFTQINNGSWFPAKQDRTHDASVVLSYEPSHKWIFALVWVYATGNAVTFPIGKYNYEGQVVSYYTERNGYRMPSYHRMDISFTYRVPKKRKIESEWNFSVYNVYDRHNAYSIDFESDPNDPTKIQAVKTWLFGVIPAITYNFKF